MFSFVTMPPTLYIWLSVRPVFNELADIVLEA